MQTLTAAVGTGQRNASADASLVQAMLVLIRRSAGAGIPPQSYLTAYDGQWGPASNAALRAFQIDKVFVSADGRSSTVVPNATAGVVMPGDASWIKLLGNTPVTFADLRVLPGGKTAYVAANSAQLRAKLSAVTQVTFAPSFKSKVLSFINQVHAQYGIACGVCRDGGRRDFQTQYQLRTSGRGVTNAGPGESNHNFGRAADLGFAGLTWLRKDGSLVGNEDDWLHQLDPRQTIDAEARLFWDALRMVGARVGLFRGPAADRPHLQDWPDASVSMAARLADLLTRSGSMKWSAAHGKYNCDLGLSGAHVPVGTAVEIWNNQASLTVAALQQARTAAAARAKLQPPPTTTQADVANMQRILRKQFELADVNWQNWAPR